MPQSSLAGGKLEINVEGHQVEYRSNQHGNLPEIGDAHAVIERQGDILKEITRLWRQRYVLAIHGQAGPGELLKIGSFRVPLHHCLGGCLVAASFIHALHYIVECFTYAVTPLQNVGRRCGGRRRPLGCFMRGLRMKSQAQP